MESLKNWSEVLNKLDIQVPRGKNEFATYCPFHVDHHVSLSINLDKGVWICFAGCGQGKLSDFVSTLSDVTYVFDPEDFHLSDIIDTSLLGVKFSPILEGIDFPSGFSFQQVPKWIFNRGFSKDTLREWKCGVNKFTGSLIIPVFNETNTCMGWAARRKPNGEDPRWMYPNFFSKSSVLFGLNKLKSKTIICLTEGPLDAMWLDQNGYNAIALLGIHISNQQVSLIQKSRFEEIVLCLDRDAAGQKGTEKIWNLLHDRLQVSIIDIPEGYKDVQDIRDKEILDAVIQERRLF